jgi:hypothetical protein
MKIELDLTKKEALNLLGLLCKASNDGVCEVTSTPDEYQEFLDKVISQIRKQGDF